MQQEPRPGEHGHKRSSASRACAEEAGSWRSDSKRPPPHFDHQRGSRCLRTRREMLNVWRALKMDTILWGPVQDCLTRYSSWHGASESSNCCHGNLLRGVLLGTGVSSGDHVWFEQSSLQIHMVVRESLVHSRQDLWMQFVGNYFWWIIWLCSAFIGYSGKKLTFSVAYWHRCRSWSPSGRISGSTIGTRPFYRQKEEFMRKKDLVDSLWRRINKLLACYQLFRVT